MPGIAPSESDVEMTESMLKKKIKEKAAELEPDLVLMDVRIEGPMDGIEAAQRIRQSRDVPVVFLTAYSDVDTVERAKVVEPYGYIVKPFDPRDLHTTIEMALHKGNADRRLREHARRA